MSVFEEMRAGKAYDIRDARYQEEVHGELDRCASVCHKINALDPTADRAQIRELQQELFQTELPEGTYFTPPLQIDCGCRVMLGKNVFANHSITIMSLGTVTFEDGVMVGPGASFLTVNHEPKNIRVLKTQEIVVKKNAWIGAKACILPGVTIGENAIVATGAVVTKDVPDNCVAAGVPAKIIKSIE